MRSRVGNALIPFVIRSPATRLQSQSRYRFHPHPFLTRLASLTARRSTGTAAPLIKGTMAFYPQNATAPKGFYCAKHLSTTDADFASKLRALLTSNESLKNMDSAQVRETLTLRYINKPF